MMNLYEKYRPTDFQNVVGQDKAVKKIELLLARGWGSRAWWLAGATGTGKTTLARIIASLGADDFFIEEYDSADKFTVAELDRIDQHICFCAPGKGDRAYIVNEAHRTTQAGYPASARTTGAPAEARGFYLHNNEAR